MKLIKNKNKKHLYFVGSIYWLHDLEIRINIKKSDYTNEIDLESFCDIINFWFSEKSNKESCKSNVLNYIGNLSTKLDNYNPFCSPELLLYDESDADTLLNLSAKPSEIKKTKNGYKIKLNSQNNEYITDSILEIDNDDEYYVKEINDQLKELWCEEDKEFFDDKVRLFSDPYFFLSRKDIKSINDLMNKITKAIKQLHYPK